MPTGTVWKAASLELSRHHSFRLGLLSLISSAAASFFWRAEATGARATWSSGRCPCS